VKTNSSRGLADNLSAMHAPPPQYFCELCDEPAEADCWSYVAQMLICPRCLEGMLDANTNQPRSEVGLVGGCG